MYIIGSKCNKCDVCVIGCPIVPNCDGFSCKVECGFGYVCPVGAIIKGEKQNIITEKCNDCGKCVVYCKFGAISPGPLQQSSKPADSEL